MITVKDFKEATINCSNDTEIKMSGYTKTYILQHPENADDGYMYYSSSEGFAFEIDWNHSSRFKLKKFYELIAKNNILDDEQIISWDVDDGNMIDFDDILLIDNTIILV